MICKGMNTHKMYDVTFVVLVVWKNVQGHSRVGIVTVFMHNIKED